MLLCDVRRCRETTCVAAEVVGIMDVEEGEVADLHPG